MGDASCMNKDFAMFNDCPAFIVYKDGHIMTEKYFDIWVMHEYGVEDSWTKQLVVGPLLRIHRPLPLAKNGELLLLGDHYTHNALLKYNIGSQEIKILQPTNFPRSFVPTKSYGLCGEPCFIHKEKCVLELLILSP